LSICFGDFAAMMTACLPGAVVAFGMLGLGGLAWDDTT
jgi:hypothetical protein